MKKDSTKRIKTSVRERANRQSVKAYKRLRDAAEGTIDASLEQIAASYYLCLLAESEQEASHAV